MTVTLHELRGYALQATDGEIGHVGDVLVDDRSWQVRYLVVETGGWLTGRQVLLDPSSVTALSEGGQHVDVALTREQIENSPSIETDAPVSQQVQVDLHSYYGWPAYWGAAGAFGTIATPIDVAPGEMPDTPPEDDGDPHLRSGREITGYTLQATDDDIGHIDDVVIDPQAWTVRQAIVATRNWLPGRKVVIPVDAIEGVSWSEREVRVAMTRDEVERSQPAE